MRSLLGDQVRVVEASPPIARAAGSRLRLGRAAARHFAADPVAVCFLPGNFHWLIAPALARLPHAVRPVIVAQVSAALAKPQRNRWQQRVFEARMRWLLRGAASVVALSASAERQAAAILRRPITRAIALPALDDEMPPPHPAPQARALVAIGRLVPEKGYDTLIEALAHVADAALTIVGEGPDRARRAGWVAG